MVSVESGNNAPSRRSTQSGDSGGRLIMVDDAADPDPLEDWEEGSAFGVSEDSDPVCTVPVEEWVLELPIESTIDVPIPDRLVDQVIGQDAASIV
ncbi:MAG: hypothetical protein QF746_00630, partial [Candidatus Thalassarchaeaceae archaeon]|nr:hypothetical protein [Candidatus Thalassarchaeaceae archaeon]